MNSSIEALKKAKEVVELKMEKIRNINSNLMANLQDQKKSNDKLRTDNQKFHECYLEIEVERNSIQKQLQAKILEISQSQKEVQKLTSQLVERGETSSNCLENALSDQVEQLKSDKEMIQEKIKELTRDNSSLTQKLEKYKRALSSLTNDLN